MRIKMVQNQQNFTGVIPLRVRIDNTIPTSPKLISTACRKAVTALTTNTTRDSKEYNAMVKYMEKDKDYNPRHILYSRKYNPSLNPSDFMRVVPKDSCLYLLTGKEADQIRIAGANIGKIQGMLKQMGYLDSIELQQAKLAYKKAVDSIISRQSLRVTEGYDSTLKKKTGSPLQLILNMKSNGKYGQNNFKMQFDSIDFQPVIK